MIEFDYEKILDLPRVEKELKYAGLFLLAFELLKNYTIDQPKSFFSNEFHFKNGALVFDETEEYKKEVLALVEDKESRKFMASCLWFKENGALDENDINTVKDLILIRNTIAHRIGEFLTHKNKTITIDHLRTIKVLLHKISNWWVVNFELTIDPTFKDITADDNARVATVDLLEYIVSGIAE